MVHSFCVGNRKEKEGEGKGVNWENFCEQKFSQPLSKNFDLSFLPLVEMTKE